MWLCCLKRALCKYAFVYCPEVANKRTTAALLLDIDPIDLARGKVGSTGGGLFDYVNNRTYVSSSFLSTAISKVLGTAMTGQADAHQTLSDSLLDLTATVTMLPCWGEQEKLNSVFDPLGYDVSYETFVSDENFPDCGESNYVILTIRGEVRLRDLLKHLYVLIPIFDRQKHMGSRAVIVLCKNAKIAANRFKVNDGSFGVIHTRTGRHFFDDTEIEKTILTRIQNLLTSSGFWKDFHTDWVCLDT